jgi:lipoate-protein ligase A
MKSERVFDVFRSDGQPLRDLAREAWLMDRAAEGDASLFLTSWEGPVVVLGYAQPAEDADLDWCRAEDVPVFRRLTGGTGVVHRRDLGVGLTIPANHPWADGVVRSYDRFLEVLEPALSSLGSGVTRLSAPARASRVRSPICFLDQLSDTLVVDGKKAVGCAQTRRHGAVLIHAAILLGLDAALYSSVFGVAEEEIAEGLAPALSGVGWQETADVLVGAFADALRLEAEERSLAPIPPKYLAPYADSKWAPVR